MPDRRYTRLRIALATGSAAVVAGVVGLATPERLPVVHSAVAAPVPATVPESLEARVQRAGTEARGDLVWHGLVAIGRPGRVTIRVEYAGPPAERRMPIWPVNAWLFYSADDLRSSFAAELSGSLSWRTGELRVTGLVSDGAGVGTPLEQRMHLGQPGLAGRVTVKFFPRLAAVSPWARQRGLPPRKPLRSAKDDI